MTTPPAPESVSPQAAITHAAITHAAITHAAITHVRALDGLRGLAVLAVMVYHDFVGRNVRTFTGGFLGVDVFFVLSGFLITTLLVADHQRTGKTISWAFWERRIRRLLPALVVFLALIALYAVWLAPAYRLHAVRQSSFATLFYYQNYFQLYGGAAGRVPLSHTWSLSIEEQFYVLWPVMLAGILALGRRLRPLVVPATIGVAIIASAAMMAWKFDPQSPWRAYLGLDTRAFQLLSGALLAVFLWGRPHFARRTTRGLEGVSFAVLAVLGVLAMTVEFSTAWLYRGGLLLISGAVAIVIATALQPDARALGAVLGFRPLAAVGRLSYGLYLFHIPVHFILAPDRFDVSSGTLFIGRLALTFALAAASYWLVEQPVRRRASWLPSLRVLAPVATLTAMTAIWVGTNGAEPVPQFLAQNDAYYRYAERAPEGATRILVAGDAFAFSLGLGERSPHTSATARGVTVASAGCGLVNGDLALAESTFAGGRCGSRDTRFAEATATFGPHVVAFVSGASEVFDHIVDGQRLEVGTDPYRAALFRRLDTVRGVLTEYGARMLLLTTPCMDPPEGGQFASLGGIRRDPTRVAWLNGVWAAYAQEHDDVELADLNAVVCSDAGQRRVLPSGESFGSPDGVGFSDAGSEAIWEWLTPIARDLGRNVSVEPPRPFLE